MKIPIRDGTEWVEIKELPEEDDIMLLLNTELPPLDYWLQLAVTFM
jgi:hypothetical protein